MRPQTLRLILAGLLVLASCGGEPAPEGPGAEVPMEAYVAVLEYLEAENFEGERRVTLWEGSFKLKRAGPRSAIVGALERAGIPVRDTTAQIEEDELRVQIFTGEEKESGRYGVFTSVYYRWGEQGRGLSALDITFQVECLGGECAVISEEVSGEGLVDLKYDLGD